MKVIQWQPWKLVKTKGRVYNTVTADFVKLFDKNSVGTLWKKKNGEYFVTFMVCGIGEFYGIPSEKEVETLLAISFDADNVVKYDTAEAAR